MTKTLLVLVSLLTFSLILSQEVDIKHERHVFTLTQFNSCKQLQQAVNSGNYHFPSSWRSIECSDNNGTTNISCIIVKEPVNIVKATAVRYDTGIKFNQAVDLTGSNGGTPKVWTDRRYDTCEDWQKAVDSGEYEPPRGYNNITCENHSIAGGGVTLNGIVILPEKMDAKLIKKEQPRFNISN